jgi:superfamily II DNA helicase RecQ
VPKTGVRKARATNALGRLLRIDSADHKNSYFSSSDWAEDRMPCGHCDNCIRDPESVIERDVTPEAKRVLAVTRALRSAGHNVTTAQLAQAARGSGTLNRSLQLPGGDKVTLSPLVRAVNITVPQQLN